MAKVYVWYPGFSGIGHAALLLDRIHPPVYISWWPSERKRKLVQTSGHFTPTHESDVKEEFGNPSMTVPLKCLQEELIASWWQQVKVGGVAIPFAPNLQPYSNNYDFLANNCSTIVLKALHVGSGDGSGRIMTLLKRVATPGDVLMYASFLRMRRG
jgi:hypothetical protein